MARGLNELFHEVHQAFQQLRVALQGVQINDELKEQVEKLVTPIFADPVTCEKVTDIINEVGDFTENILVPLLEQYVSADVALRVRYNVEDILVAVEKYRDHVVKKVAAQENRRRNARLQPTVTRAPSGNQVSLNASTNHYRAALHAKKRDPRGKMNLKNPFGVNLRSVKAKRQEPGSDLNRSFLVNEIMFEKKQFRRPGLPGVKDKRLTMPGIGLDQTTSTLAESTDIDIPKMKRSGQILVELLAVGLNHYDYKKIDRLTGRQQAPPRGGPHVGRIGELRQSFLSLGQALLPPPVEVGAGAGGGAGEVQNQQEPEEGLVVMGIEFCGVVRDIGWRKGDYLHKLHVSRDDIVYGILRDKNVAAANTGGGGGVASFPLTARLGSIAGSFAGSLTMNPPTPQDSGSSGALAQYLVCDVNDIVRCPKNISPRRAAALAVDGSVVCRALAETDVANGRECWALVIGGATNAGLILLELLTRDLGLPWNNIHVLAAAEQFDMLQHIGLASNNLHNYNGDFDAIVNQLPNARFDLIFDCISETAIVSTLTNPVGGGRATGGAAPARPRARAGGNADLRTRLAAKLRQRTGQFFSMDSTKLLAEKRTRNEGWQRELNLLNKLVETKKLTLNLPGAEDDQPPPTTVPFTADNVNNALDDLRTGQHLGKLVVEINAQTIGDLKRRAGNA